MEESVSQKEKERAEEAMIEQAFQELLNDYLATKHRKRVEIITKAFNFANQAHKGIKRRSGEPYIMHPIAVAKIVCNEIGLGSTSICAALLHDVVEDTDYTVEDIENIFGPKIAQIVDGLTKISGGIFGDRASAQAENFKKLLLTMSDDIRVILIKIADRLHNMRTLGSMLPNKQFKIAGETLYIYAPLANRLGLYKIKTELENLSFRYEHPEEYREIEKKLEATAVERDKVFKEFTAPIRAQLDKMGLKYRILARIKSIYSIWNKMQTKHVPFEEIYDLLAVRIIFEPRNMEEELNDCFNIYVSISKIYKPHPDRLRDWVSHPKANGYQALHVTLMGNNGQWIEVQIRSERMNDVAEQGFAAHWKYKEGGAAYGIGRDMHVGDTIIGIKGRVGFEAAAPMLIIGAHRFLEKYTLSKWQQYWKDQVANWYGMFLHESQYLEPVMRDIEAMLQESQRNVNGTAILELRPLSFSTVGVESEDDLVKTKFGEYGEMQKGWTAEDAKGFIKVTSTPLRVYYNNHKDEEI